MTDVIIIGAGAAGLTAAYDLVSDTNLSVRVLEAHSAIGGRLRKLEEGFADFPIDIGGEWIHLEGPGILDRIVDNPERDVDVDTVSYRPDYQLYTNNGAFVPDDTFETLGDYKFVNYTWFDFFSDFLAPSSAAFTTLSCNVNLIDYSQSDVVTVSCDNGQTHDAARVLVTVPLRIMQLETIQFTPGLPNSKLDALNAVDMPAGAKLFMKFTQDFYFDAVSTEFEGSSEVFYYDATWGQDSSDFVLGMFTTGTRAQQYAGMSGQAVVDLVLMELDTLYMGQATTFYANEFYFQDWTSEPFIGGSYSFYEENGQCGSLIATIREPLDGRIFFAGEHIPIDEQWGYAHGAAMSGRDAAEELAASLNGNSSGGGSGIFGVLASLFFCLF